MLRRMRSLLPWREDRSTAPEGLPAVRRDLHDMMDEYFDRVFDGFLDPWREPPFGGLSPWSGPGRHPGRFVDVQEDETGYSYRLEVPGYDPKELDVSVDRDRILIRGRHTEESGREGEDRWARSEGTLFLTVPVPPDGWPEDATANVRNGVLTIRVPRASDEQKGIRRIPVAA